MHHGITPQQHAPSLRFPAERQYLVGHTAVVDQPRHLVLAPGTHPREETAVADDRQPLPLERRATFGVVVRIHGPQFAVERLGEMLAAVGLALELQDPFVGARSRSDM